VIGQDSVDDLGSSGDPARSSAVLDGSNITGWNHRVIRSDWRVAPDDYMMIIWSFWLAFRGSPAARLTGRGRVLQNRILVEKHGL
jgi:hypothetical protein